MYLDRTDKSELVWQHIIDLSNVQSYDDRYEPKLLDALLVDASKLVILYNIYDFCWAQVIVLQPHGGVIILPAESPNAAGSRALGRDARLGRLGGRNGAGQLYFSIVDNERRHIYFREFQSPEGNLEWKQVDPKPSTNPSEK